MKDGSTHLAHKAEHAIDLGEDAHGAILAVNICDASVGDTNTLADTIGQARENLDAVAGDARVCDKIDTNPASELVDDKGYHSRGVMKDVAAMNIRTYTSEPRRGRRKWHGDIEARDAVYANRRRIKGNRGKALLRKRGELIERTFAHCYETGAMRRVHLRHRENITRRVLIHAAGFNLGLLLRVFYGLPKPRNTGGGVFALILCLWTWLRSLHTAMRESWRDPTRIVSADRVSPALLVA